MSASLPAKAIDPDIRKPNERRLDEIIEQNEAIVGTNRAILVQITKMNANLAIVGEALIKMTEKSVKNGKKVVDTK